MKGVDPLANHKSAIKRARQNEIRRMRNKSSLTRTKNANKAVRTAVVQSPELSVEKLNNAKSVYAKAVKKGVLHKNTAARKISALHKLVNSASQ
jgi:small subunit ribosomal protein S20